MIMQFARIIGLLVFLSAPWFAPRVSEAAMAAPRALIRLRISYSSPIGVMAPLWMAAESGAFKREALDGVKYKSIQPPTGTPCLRI